MENDTETTEKVELEEPSVEKVINLNGHQELLTDLDFLFREAKAFEFHDFKNSKYDTPKVMLVELLKQMTDKCVKGFYDQKSETEE